MASKKLAAKSADICHRCLQPVQRRAARCPHCGSRLPHAWYMTLIPLGILGLLALVFVAALVIKSIRNEDIENAPPQAQTQEEPPLGAPPTLDR
ncbi:MAG: hypothetical protein ABSF62_01835 [Bryobacteraceae bacterium]